MRRLFLQVIVSKPAGFPTADSPGDDWVARASRELLSWVDRSVPGSRGRHPSSHWSNDGPEGAGVLTAYYALPPGMSQLRGGPMRKAVEEWSQRTRQAVVRSFTVEVEGGEPGPLETELASLLTETGVKRELVLLRAAQAPTEELREFLTLVSDAMAEK